MTVNPDKRRIRAALIDMDGTLYDSMPSHTAAWQRMMSQQGINIPRDEFFLYEGMTGADTINLIFRRELRREASSLEIKELYAKKTEFFRESGGNRIMPGAPEMLKTLKNNGIECILVTGSGQQSLLERVTTDFPAVFSPKKMVTAHNVSRGKPHPEPYLKAMELAGATPDECIVIENAPLGVQAGKAAGAFTIGVITGPIPEETMLRAGADIIFPSMTDFALRLPDLLQQLGG